MPTLPDDHLPLSESELRLIKEWRAQGLTYLAKYGPAHSFPPLLSDLDATFLAWRTEPVESRPHANDVLNGLSVLLADHLFADSPCQWVVIDDKLGVRLAVFHEASGWSLNIRDIFAKRMTLEVAWIEQFFDTMKADLASKSR